MLRHTLVLVQMLAPHVVKRHKIIISEGFHEPLFYSGNWLSENNVSHLDNPLIVAFFPDPSSHYQSLINSDSGLWHNFCKDCNDTLAKH